jgi:flagellar hook assembly protein FlgD
VTKLDPARPNPFAQTVTLSLSLAQAGPADLVVYSVSGRRVRTLARGAREPGVYDFEWDGRDDAGSAVAAGIYYVHLITAGREFTRKVTFLR